MMPSTRRLESVDSDAMLPEEFSTTLARGAIGRTLRSRCLRDKKVRAPSLLREVVCQAQTWMQRGIFFVLITLAGSESNCL